MKQRRFCRINVVCAGALFFSAAVLPPAARAAGEAGSNAAPAQTIFVYGDRVQPDVPVPGVATRAATVLAGDQAQSGGIAATRDLTGYIPNLGVFNANNDRLPRFSVRGWRENNFAAGNPVVGLYVDDVPYADLDSRGLELFDLERVEFLPGPQGSVYGASGPAGVMNIVTRRPSDVWQAHAGVGLGNYDSQDYRAGVSGPLAGEELLLGMAGLYSRRDGFVHNAFLDTHPDSRESQDGRASLRWAPDETWDFEFMVAGQKHDDGFIPTYYPAVDPGLYTVYRDTDGYNDTESFDSAFRAGYRASSCRVSSVTTYRDWKQDLLQDFDFSPMPIRLGFSIPERTQWTEELRVRSLAGAEPVQWATGFYFSDSDGRNDSGSIESMAVVPGIPPPVTMRTVARSDETTYALFGEAAGSPAAGLDLTAGLRLSRDERSMNRRRTVESALFPPMPSGQVDGSDHFDSAQPRVGAAYRVTPSLLGYVSASAGYLSGGFNTTSDDPSQSRFDPARSWTYEAGLKSDWFDKRLRAHASVFYTDTEDYQVFRLSRIDPSQAYMVNADRATSQGAEADVAGQAAEGLTLSAAAGYVDAEFDRFTDPANGEAFDGNTIDFVPRFTGNVAAEWRVRKFHVRAEAVEVGDFYLDTANTAEQDAYTLVNGRIGYTVKSVDVSLFGRNLFDTEYYSNAVDLRSVYQPDLLVFQPGDPRTFGVALSAKF